ncbi:MAG TPA: hypothetical protein VJT13_22045 [Xanthobacteraceae bacterium]|nr:hypothetical protein [Xanthobacteraceae bacterium]
MIDEPTLVREGLAHARKHMATDPNQSAHFEMWQALLRRDVEEIVRSLLEDTPHGALLRDTQPVFVVLPDDVRRKIIAAERGGPVAA